MIESVTIKGHKNKPTVYVDKQAEAFKFTARLIPRFHKCLPQKLLQ